MDTFGERLKFLRGGVSQSDLARLLGIRQTTLSNYERCRNEPNYATVRRICSHFGVDPEWFMFGTGRNPCPSQALEKAQGQKSAVQEGGLASSVIEPACTHCQWLEARLDLLDSERRELLRENRTLWRENTRLQEEVGRLRVDLVRQEKNA